MSCSTRTARRRTSPCTSSPPTSAPIRRRRSLACRRCSRLSPPVRAASDSRPAPLFARTHTPMNSMTSFVHHIRRPSGWPTFAALALVGACAPSATTTTTGAPAPMAASAAAPSPDPRLTLKPGLYDAGEAAWNLKVLSKTPPSEKFKGGINSDLAFTGNYVIQGSYSGYQVWDISNPNAPTLKTAYYCPASQSDVSVYKNLLFVSGEDLTARLDCGA